MAYQFSAQIEEVTTNHIGFRDDTKYRNESVLKYYLEFNNARQIILVYGIDCIIGKMRPLDTVLR